MSFLKVLVLGVTGMFGHTLFSQLAGEENLEVYGSARNSDFNRFFTPEYCQNIIHPVLGEDFESFAICLSDLKPQVVINCIGIIKQVPLAVDALKVITMNALLPHRLAVICKAIGAKLVQISTDCVFSGKKGNYRENDTPDPLDLYGQTKLLGEVNDKNSLTIRTSIIGHELKSANGLLEWFLSQNKKVKGFKYAIFNGLPTIEVAKIFKNYIIPDLAAPIPKLHGLYQVSAEPISKYDLLQLIAKVYQIPVEIEADDSFYGNRSLNSARFQRITGYSPPSWPELIREMYQDFITAPYYKNRWAQEVTKDVQT
ncbi:MAG TPA: NAD(P)-dependent oxidoreductase [Firmicutes bacterium]|jgi:dTDP-4-dehydrorhamnose reductase|nr:NAD(P)-dependent oxidoreductase [Bacillota bacterium]